MSFTRFRLLPLLAVLLLSCGGARQVEVLPAPSDQFLLNPHRGFATTHQFNDNIRGIRHPQCTIVQFRWYWDELEPEEGKVNFALIDSVLARCRANGQKLNFRVMCQNGRPGVPQWVRAAGAKGEPYQDNPANWQPRYDDPVFLAKHENLIRALGERYDGHPDMDHMDIGTVGRWGEWHTSGTGMEMPDTPTRQQIIDSYLAHFRQTPLIMLIGGGEGLAYAVANGAGWRADCLGDLGGFRPDWSHMENFYPQALQEAEALDSWKHAPVVFETCWTIQTWLDKGWDLDYILRQALEWHISVLNNGSEEIPEQWWPQVQEFERRMGYRYALKRLSHPARVRPGGTMLFELEWENQGVAPLYRNYPLTFELRSTATGASRVLDTGIDPRGWLPGVTAIQQSLVIPADLAPGEYELGLGLVDPREGRPVIRFANAGQSEEGWLRLSRIELR